MSHLSIYRKLANENIPYAFVLEDDVELDLEIQHIHEILTRLPDDWEVVLLGHHGRNRNIDAPLHFFGIGKIYIAIINNYKCTRFSERPVGAYGYLIKKQRAEKLLFTFAKIDRSIDHWSGNIINLYGISLSMLNVIDDFSIDRLLSNERKNIVVEKFSYQKFKDVIQSSLKKVGLLNELRSFFFKLKSLPAYLESQRVTVW